MTGRVYEVPDRDAGNRTTGAAGSWQAFEGGLVRVVVQGAGWPTNVLVERVVPCSRFGCKCGAFWPTSERFVRPARGMRRVRA